VTIRVFRVCSINTAARPNEAVLKPLLVSFAMSRSVFVALLLLSRSVFAQWAETGARNENSSVPGLTHRHVEMEEKLAGEVASLDLALFSMKTFALRVIDNPDGAFDLAGAAAREKCGAGVNGGYFDPAFAPLGLRVEGGQIVRPMLRARLMTGVLLSAPGLIQILRVADYSPRRKAIAAVQCGPLLVDGGLPVKGLDRTRAARRTFALVAADRAALGICSETSLADVAQILSALRFENGLKVSRALNLDGGSSSAFWFKRADGSVFSIAEMKNVRDFVGVVPR
jgi:uncharacterized protein YigE (DUF2233 family)